VLFKNQSTKRWRF